MGFMRWMMLGNLGQQLDIEEQREEIGSLQRRLDRESLDGIQIDRLSDENKELKLYIATIFRVLVSKGIISSDELKALIDTVDSEDGREDGSYGGDVISSTEG